MSRWRRRCNTKSSKCRWRRSVAGSRVDERAPRGGWAPTDACGRLQIVGGRVVGNRNFLPLCYPGVAARVFRAFSPRTCTKVPGLTGTTPLSRKPAPARAVRVFRTTATARLFLDTVGTDVLCKETAPKTRHRHNAGETHTQKF